jgi:DNA-binding PadR family transcriptional regulator
MSMPRETCAPSDAMLRVLSVFVKDALESRCASELMGETGMRLGRLNRTLRRLEDDGWIERRWDDPVGIAERARERYYQLTSARLLAARAEIRRADSLVRLEPPLNWLQ